MDMLKSLRDLMKLGDPATPMHVLIHEDNFGAQVLVETLPPQFTSKEQTLCN
ncbi:hypothetical protein ACHAWO_000702 [Cyclotella atomus]|jgi:hypothetical protein|uniref:Uncharacterized protein n=1 Tax=Cyclotella atomus TaxID=382360 RepID=A0ABD3QY17_9STRA